jgi:cytochrome c oxidase subunit 2
MKKIAAAIFLGLFVFVLAACGSSGNNSSGGAASPGASPEAEVVIKASNWKFDQETYQIPKDTPVQLTLVNEQGVHGIEIEGLKLELRPGKETAVVQLKEGEYTIRCSIQCGTGHAQMKAKLVVA